MKYFLFFIFLMSTMALSSLVAKTGIGLSELRRVNTPHLCGFFVRNDSSFRYDRVSEALEKVAGPKSGRPTSLTLSPWIGLFGGRFNPSLLRSQIMNTSKSAQIEQTTQFTLQKLSEEFCTAAFYAGAMHCHQQDIDTQKRRLKLFAHASFKAAETALALIESMGGES